MVEIGRVALILGFLVAAYSAVTSVVAARTGSSRLMASARRGIFVVFGLVTIGSAALLNAILTHDFRVMYVYEYSSTDMDLVYQISSFWAGNAGSILLWGWVLSMFSAIALLQTRNQNKELAPYVFATLMVIQTFFLVLSVFVTNPFERLPTTPAEGYGLNPLLENPGMFLHPTTLYLGYVGFTIPFAFAVAALITGQLNTQWIRSTRRWALFAWLFLSLGNLFGAWWAYNELSWGGMWAWDPVENASFLPWLVGTAYLHSVMIQERRGMLKIWNLVLIGLVFALTIFGTFLTRSGVLASVHSFGDSGIGPFFLTFLVISIFAFLGLLIYRLPKLKSENDLDSFVSRESSFLLNNLMLVGAAFAVFFGTVYPLISEWVRDVKVTVGPPFYNQITTPIFLILIALMGICPLIGWRRASRENLIRNFLYPVSIAAVGGVIMFALGVRGVYSPIAYILMLFVVATISLEVLRGMRARHRTKGENYVIALGNMVWRNKPRYGGYIVHIGVILIAMGTVASMTNQSQESAFLARGESINIRNYTLTYEGMNYYPTKTKEVVTASLSVYDGGGDRLGTVRPGKTFKKDNPEDAGVSEVGLRSTLKEDLYVVLAGWEGDSATFKVMINPLMVWVWIGGAVMIAGTVVAFWPDAREKRRRLLQTSVATEHREGYDDPDEA